MNYQKIYEQLTSKNMIAEYTEKHHIIPKCMGGSDEIENIVCLTPEAHYVAHQLLVKIYPDKRQLIYAANMMTVDSHGYRVNNKLYGWLRRKLCETLKNRTMSNETRSKMSFAKKNISNETRDKLRNARKGKIAVNKGIPHTAETKAKMSAIKKGKPSNRTGISRSMSAETKAKISASKKGKVSNRKGSITSEETKAKMRAAKQTVSIETRIKISNSLKNKPKVICPHCNKEGNQSHMTRYHFENCKLKEKLCLNLAQNF
jgi:NUMOD3 motif